MWRRSGGVFLPASARRQRRPTPTTAPLVVAAVAKLSTTTTTVRPPVAAVAGERQQWPRRRCHHHHYHDQHHDHHTNTAGSRRCFSFFEDVGNGSEETLRRTTTTNPTTINTNTKTNTHTTTTRMGTAVYTLYGETCAFSVKAIPPEFRAVSPSGLLVLDAHKRGRFLFEWTPAVPTPNRSATTTTTPNSTRTTTTKTTYQWSATTRLALTVEEAGSLLARVDRGDPTVTFQRRIPSSTNSTNSADDGNHTKSTIIDKICIATRIEIPSMTSPSTAATEATTPPPPPHTRVMDGLSLLVDYIYPDGEGAEVEGKGRERDQQGLRGPFEIRLTIGDYAVFRSILETSIPHLAGWSLMLEHQLAQSVHQHRRNTSSRNSSSRNMATRTPPPPPSTPKTNTTTKTTGNTTARNSDGLSYDPTSPHNYN